jgi:DNA replication protein DnaC
MTSRVTLRQLKLPTFLREYKKLAAEAAREGLDHVRFLLRLAELELIDRERRMVERRIRTARFPAVKSFDTFDFAAIPSLNKPPTEAGQNKIHAAWSARRR